MYQRVLVRTGQLPLRHDVTAAVDDDVTRHVTTLGIQVHRLCCQLINATTLTTLRCHGCTS